MLLWLLGLGLLSVICRTDQNQEDGTVFYNEESHGFENTKERMARVQRSLAFNNFSDMNTMGPADMSVMFPDTSICDVLLSSSEPISIDQIPLFCLCSHCKETTGAKGDKGDRGFPGHQGFPGRRGLMGFRGRRGFTGPPGVKGQKGDLGDKGQLGPIGFVGAKGALGVKGEKGDHGDDGPSGPSGPQGEAGSCLCESVIGPPGVQGPPGTSGARGLPGVPGSKGTAGAQGDKGDAGVNGRGGENGFKGMQGDSGPCNCSDGVNGADGLKGEKGDRGSKGDTGPKGDQGDAGFPGMPGDPGYPGIRGPCSLAFQSAFTVALETPFPLPDQTVKFTRSIYNVQDHYNTETGIFFAPVNGTYVFNFHLTIKERILIAGLYVNFHPILSITETTSLATVSQRVVLSLKTNDMVWVQVKDDSTNGMWADTWFSSTFSGFLLAPDVCSFGTNRDFQPIDVDKIAGMNYTWIEQQP